MNISDEVEEIVIRAARDYADQFVSDPVRNEAEWEHEYTKARARFTDALGSVPEASDDGPDSPQVCLRCGAIANQCCARRTPVPADTPSVGEREASIQQWHAASDHAKDGTPLGGYLCNCERIVAKAESLGWLASHPTPPEDVAEGPYTPTTEEVRNAWLAWHEPGDDRWTAEQFDRWFSALAAVPADTPPTAYYGMYRMGVDQNSDERWHTDGWEFHYLNSDGDWCDIGFGMPSHDDLTKLVHYSRWDEQDAEED